MGSIIKLSLNVSVVFLWHILMVQFYDRSLARVTSFGLVERRIILIKFWGVKRNEKL